MNQNCICNFHQRKMERRRNILKKKDKNAVDAWCRRMKEQGVVILTVLWKKCSWNLRHVEAGHPIMRSLHSSQQIQLLNHL